MLIAKGKFTEGYFKSYMGLVITSGTLMSIYLLASLVSKLDLAALSKYNLIIKSIGYVAEIIAAIVFIKSSKLLDKMANKYSFKESQFFNQFKES